MTEADRQEQGSRQTHHEEKPAQSAFQRWWQRNKAWVLVLTAECFGACMAATARLLEDEDKGAAMHPMQIIFVRMGLTCILSTVYMRATNVPDFPLGPPDVRWMLVVRGLTGFFGLSAFYWALQYLPLAETTVITFLTPLMVPAACALLFHEPLSKKVVVAGIVSFVGVIIIARPPWLFPNHEEETPSANATLRTLAVTFLLIGSVTATVSYTIIRGIGYRAHALISVNYYAFMSTLGAAVFIVFTPSITFRLPADGRQWALLSAIGFSGFFLQFLLTAGLQHDKSAVATTMMYSQVLFALVFDKAIWGNVPGTASLCGSALVLASTIYVALFAGNGGGGAKEAGKESVPDEEQALLAGHRVPDAGAARDGEDAEGANLVNE